MISIVLMLFLVVGAVSAADSNNVSSTEDSNLISDDVSTLSIQNKLEVSNEDSISETNIVNSHDDILNDYPNCDVLSSYNNSNEDNGGQNLSSNSDVVFGDDELSAVIDNSDYLSADSSKVSTTLDVSDTHYSKTATFKVTLKDNSGKAIANQKVSLKVKGKIYSATSDKSGVALVKTVALAIGTYDVTVSYAGNANYGNSTLSKKVRVLSSISANDLTMYYGDVSVYSVKYWKDNDALANTKVSLTVHGVKYTKTTDKNGVVEMKVNLAPGTYDITTSNPYSQEKSSKKIISKKDKTTIKHGATSTYIAPNKKYSFTVTVKTAHNAKVANRPVYFTFNNKQVIVKTNANGKATLVIPALSKGTYSISYRYKTDHLYYGSSESGKIYVQNPIVKLSSSTLKMKYNDGSKFTVSVKNSNDKPLANINVKFTLNGKTYSEKTNAKGIAYLTVGNLKPGTYTVKYQSESSGSKYYNSGSNKIVISKQTAVLSAGNLVMNYKDGSSYSVTVKTKSGNPLKNTVVKFTINGKTYAKKTDSNGVAKLDIGLAVGYYSIKSVISNSYYMTSAVTKHVVVNGTKFVAKNIYATSDDKVSYSITALNYKNNPIANAKLVVKIDSKTYNVKTNSKGVAKVSLGALSEGTHTIKYSHGTYSGSSKIYVLDKVTIAQLISSSNTVKKYIQKYKKLPTSVKIGSRTYTTAEYVYMASKAIINLKSGSKASVPIKNVNHPTKAGRAANLGNLYNYLAVAKSVVKYADSYGRMPNSVSSTLGNIGYSGIVYAFSRVVSFYGDDGVMPSYVAIKSLDSSSSSTSSKLNSPNTIKNLAAYLAASTNCQVNNAKIKAIVAKLTKGLTTDTAKAKAIYNYVRDTISYSFYYDTKYGAVGTLNARTGNCVDHSHLLVAMYRAAELPARYVHGTCTFSGGTYGHVWTQVLIGNTWIVSDATSSRNSFGYVANWNANSYSLHGYYSSLSF